MQPDLRAFLDVLERHDKLVRLPRPVHPHTELAALVIEAERRGQAVLFEAVHGSAMRVVANIVGDRRMLALGLGVEPGERSRPSWTGAAAGSRRRSCRTRRSRRSS